jgi:hypothetical protein
MRETFKILRNFGAISKISEKLTRVERRAARSGFRARAAPNFDDGTAKAAAALVSDQSYGFFARRAPRRRVDNTT